MKRIFKKLIQMLIKKSVTEVVENAPEIEPISNAKKELWKFVIQTIISILTAILAALGTTSCMSHF